MNQVLIQMIQQTLKIKLLAYSIVSNTYTIKYHFAEQYTMTCYEEEKEGNS